MSTNENQYEMTLQMTGLTEYGASFNAIMDAEAPIPPEGARFDVPFEGTIKSEKINGTVVGVDHLTLRGDGRSDLNIFLTITTDDGQNISGRMTGNAIAREGTSLIDFRENGTLFTSAEDYKWVNFLQAWASGTVDRSTGEIKLSGTAK